MQATERIARNRSIRAGDSKVGMYQSLQLFDATYEVAPVRRDQQIQLYVACETTPVRAMDERGLTIGLVVLSLPPATALTLSPPSHGPVPPQPAVVDALSAAIAGTLTHGTGGASRLPVTATAAAAAAATWAAAVAVAVAGGGSVCRSTAAAVAAADRLAVTRAAAVEALRRAVKGRRALVRKAAAAAAVTVATWRRPAAGGAEADACERRTLHTGGLGEGCGVGGGGRGVACVRCW